MDIEQYCWNIEQLQNLKKMAFVSQEDIDCLERMLRMLEGESEERISLKDRFFSLNDNLLYQKKEISLSQSVFLKILEEEVKGTKLKAESIDKSEFKIKEILNLLEEFLKWLPSEEIRGSLEYYYRCHFADKFLCKDFSVNLGETFCPSYNNVPYIMIRKTDFFTTFITLIHELGHVLCYMLDIQFYGKKTLFAELSGLYFELLALQFLKEKNMFGKEALTNEIYNYNDFVVSVSRASSKNIWKSFFHLESLHGLLMQIYSYLGSLEIVYRYNGDIEKQLSDFMKIELLEMTDSIDQFLFDSGFYWRTNEFKVLKKHREHLFQTSQNRF